MLPDVQLAYATYGQLSARGTPSWSSYTASHALLAHGSGVAEGSWAPLIGPRSTLDPERFFIVCPNMLGCATAARVPRASTRPPDAAVRRRAVSGHHVDIVASQYALLQRLGVTHLRAV